MNIKDRYVWLKLSFMYFTNNFKAFIKKNLERLILLSLTKVATISTPPIFIFSKSAVITKWCFLGINDASRFSSYIDMIWESLQQCEKRKDVQKDRQIKYIYWLLPFLDMNKWSISHFFDFSVKIILACFFFMDW